MLRRSCLAFGLAFVVFTTAAASSPEKAADAQTFIRFTRELERQPLSDTDKSKRRWLMNYAEESDDIVVNVCDVLGPLPSDVVPYGAELLFQAMFGNAAFQLEHPGTTDEQAMQVAGMESLLSAYASILDADPGARIPYFDEMRTKQANGELAAAMAPAIQSECIDAGKK